MTKDVVSSANLIAGKFKRKLNPVCCPKIARYECLKQIELMLVTRVRISRVPRCPSSTADTMLCGAPMVYSDKNQRKHLILLRVARMCDRRSWAK